MANLTDNPEFTANEVYEIQATDTVEGAAAGASFDGIGLSNQPHQQLANRTAFLKQRQDSNIANITTLQAFIAGFTGSLQQSGYLQIPIADINRGSAIAIVQWGNYPLEDLKVVGDQQFNVTWPIEFPNACFIALSTDLWVKATGLNLVANVVSLTKTGGTFVLDIPDALSNGPEQSNGFNWIAIGF
jgi:Putative tail fiber protein gp53-like, C-terminal